MRGFLSLHRSQSNRCLFRVRGHSPVGPGHSPKTRSASTLLRDNLPCVNEGAADMASNHQTPLWNQDLVVAGGLAFAGMMAFEGKLFAAIGPRLPLVSRVLDS